MVEVVGKISGVGGVLYMTFLLSDTPQHFLREQSSVFEEYIFNEYKIFFVPKDGEVGYIAPIRGLYLYSKRYQ